MIAETFRDGLLITGIGMGLVFLTLIIVMYVIKALDWAFKPKTEASEAVVAAPVVAPVAATVAVPVASTDNVARAAAAGVALALQQASEMSVAVAATAAAAVGQVVYRGPVGSPKPWEELYYEEDADGETVTVIDIQPGAGTWKGTGRIQGLK